MREIGTDVCIACPQGKYQSNIGSTGCVEALPGSYGNGGASSVSCTQGFFVPSPNATRCTPCSKGRFANISSSSFCWKCPIGKAAEGTGFVAPTCSPGSYSNITAQKCVKCPVATHNLMQEKACAQMHCWTWSKCSWIIAMSALSNRKELNNSSGRCVPCKVNIC